MLDEVPEIDRPGIYQPDVGRSLDESPEIDRPEIDRPGIDQPDVESRVNPIERLGIDQPGVGLRPAAPEWPGDGNGRSSRVPPVAEIDRPEIDRPGIDQPDVGLMSLSVSKWPGDSSRGRSSLVPPAPDDDMLTPTGYPPPNTAADTAHSVHGTQPALPPHRATPRVEDSTPADAPAGETGPCWRAVAPEADTLVLFRADRMLHKVAPSHARRFALTTFFFAHVV